MRTLRWKSRYGIGDAGFDRHRRSFLDCFNRLIAAARQREHCAEMQDLIEQLSAEAESALQDRTANLDLNREFGRRLLASLPLAPFGGVACRTCGLCRLVEDRAAEPFDKPARCLFEEHRSSERTASCLSRGPES